MAPICVVSRKLKCEGIFRRRTILEGLVIPIFGRSDRNLDRLKTSWTYVNIILFQMRKFGEIILVKVSLRGAIFGKISSVDYSRKNNSVIWSHFWIFRQPRLEKSPFLLSIDDFITTQIKTENHFGCKLNVLVVNCILIPILHYYRRSKWGDIPAPLIWWDSGVTKAKT